MQGITDTLGQNNAVTLIAIFFGLLILLLVSVWLFRKIAGSGGVKAQRSRQPRLSVTDAAIVDDKRRLVLVRRDNVEHLVMIGGPSDIVIEQGIVRALPVGAAGRAQANGRSRPVDETPPPPAEAQPAPEEPAAPRAAIAAPALPPAPVAPAAVAQAADEFDDLALPQAPQAASADAQSEDRRRAEALTWRREALPAAVAAAAATGTAALAAASAAPANDVDDLGDLDELGLGLSPEPSVEMDLPEPAIPEPAVPEPALADFEFDLADELERDLAIDAGTSDIAVTTQAPDTQGFSLESALAAELGEDQDERPNVLASDEGPAEMPLAPEPEPRQPDSQAQQARGRRQESMEDEMQRLLDELSSA